MEKFTTYKISPELRNCENDNKQIVQKRAQPITLHEQKFAKKKCGHFVETPGINWYKELGLFSVKHEMVLNQESNRSN